MKNILISIKQFIHQLTKKSRRGRALWAASGRGMLIAMAALLLMVIVFASIGLVKAYTENGYESTVAFDQTQPLPVVLNDRKTEIKPGLAKADIDKLNNEKDPEAIKAYIQEKADEYGIDWKLVYAIGAYESGYFKSSLAQRQNNFFGRKATNTTWMSWNTPQEGIDNQFEYLKTRYIDNGLDTPAEMNHIYCEGDTWQYKVQFIMNSV